MTHIGFETKLRSVVKSHMHPCPGICVATGRAVVNHAWAARSLSAGIECRHCTGVDLRVRYIHFILAPVDRTPASAPKHKQLERKHTSLSHHRLSARLSQNGLLPKNRQRMQQSTRGNSFEGATRSLQKRPVRK